MATKDPALARYAVACFAALMAFGKSWALSACDRDIAMYKAALRFAKRERESIANLATGVQTAAAELHREVIASHDKTT